MTTRYLTTDQNGNGDQTYWDINGYFLHGPSGEKLNLGGGNTTVTASNEIVQIGTSYIRIPQGVSNERPVPGEAGMIRYNTTDIVLEYYNGTSWLPVSSQPTNKPIEEKTATYDLVATDNNKRVIMDSSSATNITINNSVFVAGDSVFIANKGAGTTTIVEGAGVSIGTTAGLVLEQYRSALLLAFSASNFSLFLSAGRSFGITATGGNVSDVVISGVEYRIHTYDVVGTFSFVVSSLGSSNGAVDYLVVAGGGAGAGYQGGGAGGYRDGSLTVSISSFSVSVGAGGLKGSTSITAYTANAGGNSVFSTINSAGGGGAGNNDGAGGAGGSGGGTGWGGAAGGAGNTPPTVPSQGNSGGINGNIPNYGGGAGGGAGAAGQNGTGSGISGDGGVGLSSSINGVATFYSGGGGGSFPYTTSPPSTGGAGGLGGGGAGSATNAVGDNAQNGSPNTGGGGGGASYDGSVFNLAGDGGSGIVIIRYPIYV